MNNPKQKIKDFWGKYETKIVLVAGFILVSVISFEAGMLGSRKFNPEPVIIEKPASNPAIDNLTAPNTQGVQNSPAAIKSAGNDTNALPANCAFVGSKNSNKYHLPICRYAKNINPENLTCFSSEDEAKSKGYVPDRNCIK